MLLLISLSKRQCEPGVRSIFQQVEDIRDGLSLSGEGNYDDVVQAWLLSVHS